MPPSALRFRPLQHGVGQSSSGPVPPRTPKSPRGVYTGEPVPHHRRSHSSTTQIKRLVFFLLSLITICAGLVWLLPPLRFAIPGIRNIRPLSAEVFLSAPPSQSHSQSQPQSQPTIWPEYAPAAAVTAAAVNPPTSTNPDHNANANANNDKKTPETPKEQKQKQKQFVPDFPLSETTFQDIPQFQNKGKGPDSAWRNMFPHGGGSIAVPNPRDYGLPPSMVALDALGNNVSDTEIYEVSVIRQLGCLSLFRRILIDYEDHVEPQVQTQTHAFHCLDHVRQAILCASDTSLEPINDRERRPYPDVMMGSSNGATGFKSARHLCKDWSQVRAWIEVNRPADI